MPHPSRWISVSPPRRAKPRNEKEKSVGVRQFIPNSWQGSDVEVDQHGLHEPTPETDGDTNFGGWEKASAEATEHSRTTKPNSTLAPIGRRRPAGPLLLLIIDRFLLMMRMDKQLAARLTACRDRSRPARMCARTHSTLSACIVFLRPMPYSSYSTTTGGSRDYLPSHLHGFMGSPFFDQQHSAQYGY